MVRCGTIRSCQSGATSEIVKRGRWPRVAAELTSRRSSDGHTELRDLSVDTSAILPATCAVKQIIAVQSHATCDRAKRERRRRQVHSTRRCARTTDRSTIPLADHSEPYKFLTL